MTMNTRDSDLAHLTNVVASLVDQMAALTPFVANQAGNSVHPAAPAPGTKQSDPITNLTPTIAAAPATAPAASASTTPSVPDSQETLINQEIQDEPGPSAHRRWYVVVVGLQVGVFRGWTTVAPLVLGVTGTIFNREPTREAAIVAFNAAAASGQVRIIG